MQYNKTHDKSIEDLEELKRMVTEAKHIMCNDTGNGLYLRKELNEFTQKDMDKLWYALSRMRDTINNKLNQ